MGGLCRIGAIFLENGFGRVLAWYVDQTRDRLRIGQELVSV